MMRSRFSPESLTPEAFSALARMVEQHMSLTVSWRCRLCGEAGVYPVPLDKEKETRHTSAAEAALHMAAAHREQATVFLTSALDVVAGDEAAPKAG